MDEAPLKPERRMLKVFVAKGPQEGSSFFVSEDAASVGRSSHNKIQLDEASVSRRHAKILKTRDRYFIEDLKSRNGTWINGHIIESGKRVPVDEGVPVAIGNVVISLISIRSMFCPTTPACLEIPCSRIADQRKEKILSCSTRCVWLCSSPWN